MEALVSLQSETCSQWGNIYQCTYFYENIADQIINANVQILQLSELIIRMNSEILNLSRINYELKSELSVPHNTKCNSRPVCDVDKVQTDDASFNHKEKCVYEDEVYKPGQRNVMTRAVCLNKLDVSNDQLTNASHHCYHFMRKKKKRRNRFNKHSRQQHWKYSITVSPIWNWRLVTNIASSVTYRKGSGGNHENKDVESNHDDEDDHSGANQKEEHTIGGRWWSGWPIVGIKY